MARFTLEIPGSPQKFELYHDDDKELLEYDDFLVIIQYEFYGRTIVSENKWQLSRGVCASFIAEMTNMCSTKAGRAGLSSDDGDYIEMSFVDDLGHIKVVIEDGLIGYNGYVQVVWQIDQSYLPDLITQAEALFRLK